MRLILKKFKLSEDVLTEGTKYDKKAAKIISDSGLYDEETSNKIIQSLFREDIHAFSHAPAWLEKYLVGIARMLVKEANGNRNRATDFLRECPAVFDEYLTWIKDNREKVGPEKIDNEFLNQMSYADVKNKLQELQDERDKASEDKLSKMKFGISNYSIVPINSYEEFHSKYGGRATGNGSSDKYAGGGGTAWCHANAQPVYDSWTRGGNRFFVLQDNNWKNIKFDEKSNRDNPKDAYGNSLIALLVDRRGKLKRATLRCNHVGVTRNADNQYNTYAELSELAGFNVQEEIEKYFIGKESSGKNYFIENGVLVEVDQDIEGEFVIPDNVTSIGDNTFSSCTGLTSIMIPDSVTKIGSNAFSHCTGLVSINIPDSVTEIGNNVFYNCTSLTSVTIPDSVTTIGKDAFSRCMGLTSVTIGKSVKFIGDEAFHYCERLTGVTIPDGVTSIGWYAFSGCKSIESIIIPNSVTFIGCNAFEGCTSLQSITLPNRITNIFNYTFNWCTGLTSVTIPDSVTKIGIGAFNYCQSLVNVKIPNSVTSIGEGAFKGCTELKSITLGSGLTRIGANVFAECNNLETVYYTGTSKSWTYIIFGTGNQQLNKANIYLV